MKRTVISSLLSLVMVPSLLMASGAGDKIQFTENKGQWDARALYRADINGVSLFLEKNTLTYNFVDISDGLYNGHFYGTNELADKIIRTHAFKAHLEGANPDVAVSADYPSVHNINYFRGSDPSKWATGVRKLGEVTYEGIYDNIDLIFHTQNGNVKYDFVVAPGADPAQIKMRYEGADKIRISGGRLIIETSLGSIIEEQPYVYQEKHGRRLVVESAFKLNGNTVSFDFPNGYDSQLPLVIDPTLLAATYTGSAASNWGYTATFDSDGNIYTSGIAFDAGYPTTVGAEQTTFAGGSPAGSGATLGYNYDISVTKFDSAGSNLIYSTYLGGATSSEIPMSTIVDSKDRLIIYGRTYSTDYPVSAGAYQSTHAPNESGLTRNTDIILTKLDAAGKMIASTYLGGDNDDGMNITDNVASVSLLKYNYADDARGEVVVDADDNVYVGSATHSANFPTAGSPMKTTIDQASGGDQQDGVLFKMDSTFSNLTYSTYIGGGILDAIYSIALNDSNEVYITGGTSSTDFPGVSNGFGGSIDGFLSLVSKDGDAITAGRYLGTSSIDQSYRVKRGPDGGVYVFGLTEGLYTVSAGVYSNSGSGQFIEKFDATLATSQFSTVVGDGANQPDIAPTALLIDDCGWIYISGYGRCLSELGASSNPSAYPNGGTSTSLPLTSDALQSTTDGCDFYYMVLSPNATGLHYASFLGANGEPDHVDGGTSRFDERGVTYQALCTGCSNTANIVTTPNAYSATNGAGSATTGHKCNNAVIKFDLEAFATADISITGQTTGCAPFTVSFGNSSLGSNRWTWDFGDSTGTVDQFAPSHVFNTAGTFNVIMIAQDTTGCNDNDTATVTVTVNDTPIGTFAAPNDQCSAGNSYDFTAAGGSSYSWSFGANATPSTATGGSPTGVTFNAAGEYPITVTITDQGCDTIITDTVTVLQSPTADFSTSTECGSYDVDITNNSSNDDSWAWDFGNSTTDTVQNPGAINYGDSGTYDISLIVTNNSGCVDTIQKTIGLAPVLIATFAAPAAQCFDGHGFSFAAGGNYSAGASFDWDFSGSATPATSTNQSEAGVTYTGAGVYPVSVTITDFGCDTTFTDSIEVYAMPTAGLTHNKDSICIPNGVQFMNASTGPGTISYHWEFGDGSTPVNQNQPNPYHTYNDYPGGSLGSLGQFDGYLMVTTEDGCIDSLQFTIYEQVCEIEVPNIFTPNGDGINDYLRFNNLEYFPNSPIIIYNRWGTKIYEDDNYLNNWAAEWHPDGVYYYILSVNRNGEYEKRAGWVQVLRALAD